MLEETKQVIILLIVINLALCSYYYLLYKDNVAKKDEDKLLVKLDEHFAKNKTSEVLHPKEIVLPSICNGFHDKFFDNNKYLGWRLFYLKNQSQSTVEPDPNFKDIITHNFLNNMPSVKNEVTPVKYQIR